MSDVLRAADALADAAEALRDGTSSNRRANLTVALDAYRAARDAAPAPPPEATELEVWVGPDSTVTVRGEAADIVMIDEFFRPPSDAVRWGPAVEGEPQAAEPPAPEPRFERGFYRLARNLSVKFTGDYRRVRMVAVQDQSDDDVTVWTPGHGEAVVSAAALAAAGAVRVEGES